MSIESKKSLTSSEPENFRGWMRGVFNAFSIVEVTTSGLNVSEAMFATERGGEEVRFEKLWGGTLKERGFFEVIFLGLPLPRLIGVEEVWEAADGITVVSMELSDSLKSDITF